MLILLPSLPTERLVLQIVCEFASENDPDIRDDVTESLVSLIDALNSGDQDFDLDPFALPHLAFWAEHLRDMERAAMQGVQDSPSGFDLAQLQYLKRLDLALRTRLGFLDLK